MKIFLKSKLYFLKELEGSVSNYWLNSIILKKKNLERNLKKLIPMVL